MTVTRAEARKEFIKGAIASAALLPGDAPFGLVFGAVAAQTGLAPLVAHASSYLIFAGSAQMLALGMVGIGAPALLILATAAVLNLRHILYSASVAPHLQHLNGRWKVILAYLLTDEAYAISIGRLEAEQPPRLSHWHLLGSGLLVWVQWQLSTLVGVLIGGAAPASWDLDFVVPATFIALVFPSLKDKPMAAAALSAGAVAVLAAPLPHKLNLLLAAFTGIAAGVVVQRLARKPEEVRST